MYASDDPQAMTPDERLQAVAAILAGGILRCTESRSDPPEMPPISWKRAGSALSSPARRGSLSLRVRES